MTAVDYVILLVVGVSTVGGVVKGFARSLITTVATIAGFYFAAYAYRGASSLIRPLVESEIMANFLGFLTVYLLTLMAGLFLARVLRKGFEKTRLGWLDHLMGGGFGLLRGWVLCSVIYIALAAFPVKLQWIERGRTMPYLQQGAELITKYASSYIEGHFKAYLGSHQKHEAAPPKTETK